MEKRSTPKDAVRPAVPSTTERSLREFSSPQRAFFLRCRPKLPLKAEKTPRFLKKTPRYLEHIPKVRTFASQLRTRALSSAGSERLPYKQRVGGSNPSAPTFFQTAIHRKMGSCFFCVRRKREGVGKCMQVRRSAVCIPGVGRFFRRVFLRRGRSDAVFCKGICSVSEVLGVSSSRNRSMGGVVFGKRRREKEKRWEVLSVSPPVFYPTFRTIAYAFL